MTPRLRQVVLVGWIAASSFVLLAVLIWKHEFRHYVPRELLADVKAGLAAKDVPDADARIETYLKARFGPLDISANRESAFLAFFDVDHIKGLNLLVQHTPPRDKRVNTAAMARWIANYRKTMSPQERSELQAALDSDSGRAMLQQATSQFLSQDVYYRGDQQPVISELMATLAGLRKP